MPENVFDPISFMQLKTALTGLVSSLRDGEVRMFPGFLLFRRGAQLGAAIDSGETCINIHNVHPGRSFTLDGDSALPGVAGNYLVLSVNTDETDLGDDLKREAFVNMLLFFISEQNGNREHLLANPWAWAENVIEMMGDKVSESKPYPYLAELHVVAKLVEAGLLTDVEHEYRGPDAGRHDIELPGLSLEVKSHLHASGDEKEGELVISSETQLNPTGEKPLYVVYCRMEEMGDMTLESLAAKFPHDRVAILRKIRKSGFVEGDFSWHRPYHFQREPLVYQITPAFPKITPSQFPGGVFPSGVTKLVYHVSLHNIPYCPWTSFVSAVAHGESPRFAL